MKMFKAFLLGLVLVLVVGLNIPTAILAATTPSLGAATSYGVLASTYTNTSADTTVNGDVGFTTGPAVAPLGVHNNYGSGAPYATAGADQGTALTALNSEPCTFTWGAAVDLSTDITHGPVGVYTPGVYCSVGAMSITSTINLSGSGTYIFRAVGALDTTAGATVSLSGGASVNDVFWTPSGATTLGANTTFLGTVIDDAGITVGAGTIWTGRALAFGGTVTTGATVTITAPSTLRVVKQVINDSGGSATAADFNVHVELLGVDVAGSPAPGEASPGTPYSLEAGTYEVSEDANAAYGLSFSGDCDSSGSVTLAAGDDLTCTITNNDLQSTINVVKIVINDNGGTNTVSDFPLFVDGTPVLSGETNNFPSPDTYVVTETSDPNYTESFSGDCDVSGNIVLGPGENQICVITNDDIGAPIIIPPIPPLIDVVKVPSPLSLPGGPGPVTYTYTLTNPGTEPVSDINLTGDTCSPIVLISGDTNSNNILEVSETWTFTCSTILTETHTNTVVATGTANGLTATDIASATVIVGQAIVPPLIHVTKIPNPLTLSVEGGLVTYTEIVTNPGTETMSNITLSDDTCSPMNYISGDINSNSNLESTESWIYTCSANVTSTTINTAIVAGDANGLTARDFAFATVVVAEVVPKLPNAGVTPF